MLVKYKTGANQATSTLILTGGLQLPQTQATTILTQGVWMVPSNTSAWRTATSRQVFTVFFPLSLWCPLSSPGAPVR